MTAGRLARVTALAAVGWVLFGMAHCSEPQGAPAGFAAGEKVEDFEYIVNDTEQKSGTRRVVTLDLGGGVTMEVVRIKAGTFTMGSPAGERDRSGDEIEHEVTLTKDFYLGKFEVTQAQYEAITGKNPSYFIGKQLPVGEVSWDEAAAFCTAVGTKANVEVGLPSEAEWEYACRGGVGGTPFHVGSNLTGEQANIDGTAPVGHVGGVKGEFKKRTVDVGSYKPNGFGLYDMHGNLWEWCRDDFVPYEQAAGTTDPIPWSQPSGDRRVLRGGSWANVPQTCRAAHRYHLPPDSRTRIGFRVCVRPD